MKQVSINLKKESVDFSDATISEDVKREIYEKDEDPEVGLFRTKP